MRFLLALLLSTSLLQASTLLVAAAANLSYVMESLIKEFKKTHPNTQIDLLIGGSGKLATQIQRGAPFDIFLSANVAYTQKLYKNNKALKQPSVYAQGSLALLSTKKQNFTQGMNQLLCSPNIHRIAVANPKTAPYGKATIEALNNANIFNKIQPKIVYGESIAQTIAYTLKATDIGFVATSSLYAPKMQNFIKGDNWIEIDTKLYTPISQAALLLKHAKGDKEAEEFYNFIFSDTAKKIFIQYGYKVEF